MLPGRTTKKSLDFYHEELINGRDIAIPQDQDNVGLGNGSLMRLSPVPVFYHNDPLLAIKMSRLQSRTTHRSQVCVECCALASAYILGFIQLAKSPINDSSPPLTDSDKRSMVLSATFVPDGLPPEQLAFTTQEVKYLRSCLWKNKSVDDIKTNGAAYNTLEAALWALWNSSTFKHVGGSNTIIL